MEMAENKLKEHYTCGSSTFGFSMNTPEETDDETGSVSVDAPPAGGTEGGSGAGPCAPSVGTRESRVPCESDESSSFTWNPPEKRTEGLPGHERADPEDVSGCAGRIAQPEPAQGRQDRSLASAGGVLEPAAAAQGTCAQGNAAPGSACAQQGTSALLWQYYWQMTSPELLRFLFLLLNTYE